MKKITILLTILAILTLLASCSNENKTADETLCETAQQSNNKENSDNDFKVFITEKAQNKMMNELSKSENVDKTYSVKYTYSGSG